MYRKCFNCYTFNWKRSWKC